MTQKQKRERFVAPRGVAVWPRLNTPDTKYKAEGEFSVKLAYDANDPDAQALIQKLEKKRDEEFAKFLSENPKKKKIAKVAPVARPELDDEGEETGRILLVFKMRHRVKAKATGKTYTLTPTIMNAKRVILERPPQIGGGSEMKISFEVSPAFVESSKEFHLSLRLVAVQLLKLVSFNGAARSRDDFDDEDGEDIDDEAVSTDSDDEDSDKDTSDDEDGDGDY